MFSNKQYVKFGGNLLFDEFSLPDIDISGRTIGLIKSINDNKTGKLTFKSFTSDSNKFSQRQLKSLRILINFVLPNMTFRGQPLGKDFITNVETMGAGSFGITIYYKDLIIKVLHVKPPVSRLADENEIARQMDEEDLVREVKILNNLFIDGDAVPSTINKFYGIMAGEKLGKATGVQNYYTQNVRYKFNLHSDLFRGNPDSMFSNKGKYFSLDVDNIIKNIRETAQDEQDAFDFMKTHFLNDFILLFLDKEDGDLVNYIENVVPTLDANTKLLMAKKLIVDIDGALNYMHKSKNIMHFDIKPANLAYKIGADGIPVFKLIDFGSVMPIDPVTGKSAKYHSFTRSFMNDTRHDRQYSYMYDRWCILNCALNILGIPLYNVATVLNLTTDAETISKKYGMDIHKGLQELYALMTNKYKLSLAPLTEPVKNYGIFALIYNLLATSNIPNGVPPLK